ncbi:HD domain-containing protein [Massiliimalia timonensis]|uniref:HD domain-containing protein n=1 Tax=Massiliimalia timonensis TaxID=1987501 RepID=UPI00189EF9EC|nr:HD domain-containing protein [Massiliimalia timonensis]
MKYQWAIEYIKKYASNPENKRWIQHSINVAVAAEVIAKNIKNSEIIVDKAFTCGLLHDIGRSEKNSAMHHVIHGYNLLKADGHLEEAEVCLTHSFFLHKVNYYQGDMNCSVTELEMISSFLATHEFNIYDDLIQLCDALGDTKGTCLIEQRIVDVVMRKGFKEFTVELWKRMFQLKKKFDDLIGNDLYTLFGSETQTRSLELNKEILFVKERIVS